VDRSFRGPVHRRAQPGRPGADHDQVVGAESRPDLGTDRLGDVGPGIAGQHPPISQEDHRVAGNIVQLLEQFGALGGAAIIEGVGDVVTLQPVPHLERDWIPVVADDPDQREPRRIEPGPGGQRLADHRVEQVLAGPPRLGQVVLHVTQRHAMGDDLQHARV
jgi:hypothetical protein